MVRFIRNGYLLVLIMMLVGIGLLLACSPKKEPLITGVFVNSGKSEFSIAHDTLVINQGVGAAQHQYLIERRTGISLIDEHGKIGKEILEKEHWQAEYDVAAQVLLERSKGRRIVIGDTSLTLETAVYRRLP